MYKGKAVAVAAVTAAVGISFGAPMFTATAWGCGFGDTKGCVDDGGANYGGLSKYDSGHLPKAGPNPEAHGGTKNPTSYVPYEYAVMLACAKNTDPERQEVGCGGYAESACVSVKHSPGPLSYVFRRANLEKEKRHTAWVNIAMTCWPKLVRGAKPRPHITVAMLRSAFINTPFAKPTPSMEPVGNKTLVNLPNYFTADFSDAGYGPGEIRTFTILGQKVRIKPLLKSNTFHFGDGSSFGPTESRGGGYPDGDVKHTYLKRGMVRASVTTVYTGQVSIGNGKFIDLPGTATITGPGQPIQVLEAKGRLVR